jgi:MtN3 and saliva related transmembrane protein
MIDFYELCGYSSGVLFALSLIPQVYKSYKSKDLEDISYGWQFLLIFALSLSLIYSFHKDLKPVYISSLMELFFMLLLVFMKIKYKNYDKLDEKDDNDKLEDSSNP